MAVRPPSSTLRQRQTHGAKADACAADKTKMSLTPANKEQATHRIRLSSIMFVICWSVAVSYFLITNFVSNAPWPEELLSSHRDVWRVIHAISSMMFGGTIIVSTIIEWLVVSSEDPTVIYFWFCKVPALDGAIVLPALTGIVLSGVAQANQDYGSLRESPKYIIGSLHVLLAFAVWWVLTDVTTQHPAQRAVKKWAAADEGNDESSTKNETLPPVLKSRRWSNVGSCLFVCLLYTLMALKPGHSSLDDE